MSSNEFSKINAAYVASWKERNPKLMEIKTDGQFLTYQNEIIDIRDIYMQDILSNPRIFHSITTMDAEDLFTIIKLHVCAIEMKERKLLNKARRMKEYGYE